MVPTRKKSIHVLIKGFHRANCSNCHQALNKITAPQNNDIITTENITAASTASLPLAQLPTAVAHISKMAENDHNKHCNVFKLDKNMFESLVEYNPGQF